MANQRRRKRIWRGEAALNSQLNATCQTAHSISVCHHLYGCCQYLTGHDVDLERGHASSRLNRLLATAPRTVPRSRRPDRAACSLRLAMVGIADKTIRRIG